MQSAIKSEATHQICSICRQWGNIGIHYIIQIIILRLADFSKAFDIVRFLFCQSVWHMFGNIKVDLTKLRTAFEQTENYMEKMMSGYVRNTRYIVPNLQCRKTPIWRTLVLTVGLWTFITKREELFKLFLMIDDISELWEWNEMRWWRT